MVVNGLVLKELVLGRATVGYEAYAWDNRTSIV